jgi:hypothetical protein
MADANERRSEGGHGEAGPNRSDCVPKTAAERRQPAPERPTTPLESGAACTDKPSQAEGDRDTIEEDLRIQERRAAREGEASGDRGGGGGRGRG